MKPLFRLLIFLTFIFIIQQSHGQSRVVPGWKHTVKVSLNSINKSNGLCIDKEGNCYVLLTTWYADSSKDVYLVKYDPDGVEIWERIYDNPSHGDDIPTNMCLDKEGNIWICGLARMKNNNADFLIVKFTPDGIPVSDLIYDGPDHLFDCGTTIVADRQGGVYAAGYETSKDSGINMVLLKCRADCSIIWKKTYATRQMDIANQVIVDDSSNVYVCGTSNNGPHTSDILLIKYDPEGRKKWELIYDGILSQNDAGQFITTDDSMNIYVSGFINHSNDRADIPLLKLTRNGELLQENFYNGHIADCGGISLDASRNFVYVTGGCNDYNISKISTFVIKYDKGGNERAVITAPVDVQFLACKEMHGIPYIFGAKTTHPESTLMPYIANIDTTIKWSYSDTTVEGLAHAKYVEVKDNDIYFLGDDTGDATGTIFVFKYSLRMGEDYRKRPVKKMK